MVGVVNIQVGTTKEGNTVPTHACSAASARMNVWLPVKSASFELKDSDGYGFLTNFVKCSASGRPSTF